MTFTEASIPWPITSERMRRYALDEWGRPTHDERALFELFSLEIFQAGLSWTMVLAKRPAFKQAFANFETQQVATFSATKVQALLQDKGIIRNRRKILATIHNAQVIEALHQQGQTFANYLWQFVGQRPVLARPKTPQAIPAQSHLSVLMAKELKQQGFQFVGPTTLYAFLQSAGLVDDHLII